MGQNIAQHSKDARTFLRKVFYTGSDALERGIGLCYDYGYLGGGLITDADGTRDKAVEKPDTSNNQAFAGWTGTNYVPKPGGQWIDLIEPGHGSVLNVAVLCNVTAGDRLTMLAGLPYTNAAGNGAIQECAGRAWKAGHAGVGSVIAQQTKSDVVIEENIATESTLDATGKVLTDAAATFQTNKVIVGDRVFLLGIENAAVARIDVLYETRVASVDSETQITFADAVSTGAGECFYVIIRGNPVVQVKADIGEQSGLTQALTPYGGDSAAADTFECMQSGKTYFLGCDATLANPYRAPLPNGPYNGFRKSFECLAKSGMDSVEVELDTDGIQLKVLDEILDAGSAEGDPLALHSATFSSSGHLLVLEWNGGWCEVYHSGVALSTT